MVQVYESQSWVNPLNPVLFMLPDIRSVRSKRKQKKTREHQRDFPGARIISLPGQQNPTCGTTAFFDAIRGTDNLHEINSLHPAGAFGTVVAKHFRVVEFPSRPHYVQYPLSLP